MNNEPDQGEIAELHLRLLSDSRQQVQLLAQEQGWDEDEALRIVFQNGLAVVLAQREEEGGEEDLQAAEPAALRRKLVECETRYSVMKFRAFDLQQQNEGLRFNLKGLEGTEVMWKAWAEEARAKLASLEEENHRLREQLGLSGEEVPPAAGVSPQSPLDERRPIERLKQLWRKGDE